MKDLEDIEKEIKDKDKKIKEKDAMIAEQEIVIRILRLKAKPRSLSFYRSRFNA